MRIRQHSTGHAHPREVVRVMRPQITGAMIAVRHHFKNRHKYGNAPAKNWAAEVKRLDAASGYSTALRAITQEA